MTSRTVSRTRHVLAPATVLTAGAVALLAPAPVAHAGSHCAPGKMNAAALCDCPTGSKSVGPAGNAHCEATGPAKPVAPTCGIPGRPACADATKGKIASLPSDAGAMVTVKGATFTMGSSDPADADAGPTHAVTMTDFAVDRHKVTVEEYQRCVAAGQCAPFPTVLTGVVNPVRCNYGTPRTNHPMNCVTWLEAQTYCAWKGKRLPTEAEWELAARGAQSKPYPWGNAPPTCTHANFMMTPASPKPGCGDGTSPIAQHPAGASPFGAQDMVGNVEEWVWDFYARYSGRPGTNPGGPAFAHHRVAKGVSWDVEATSSSSLHAARRESVDPGHRENWLGFRCAKGAFPVPTPDLYVVATTPPPPPPSSIPVPAGPAPSLPTPPDLGSMVSIPAGTFQMGDATEPLATPVRSVTLSPFSIDKYEITVGQYRACVSAGACVAPLNISGASCNFGKPGRDGHPVNCVDWGDAKTYCGWTGKRLPTEAEWEYAARGATGRLYPWGNAAPTCALASFSPKGAQKCFTTTTTVGSHPLGASHFGVHDMGGNVEEWISDWHAPYTPGSPTNPTGPATGQRHVVRGGNFNYDEFALRAFSRWYSDKAGDWIGFRCAKTG